ncbi:endonuclease/exonuclease/phosphatase family protein [Pseudomonas sp. NPDC089534]|uniref:endonuclease/exonuclease/phosphatase family protein n=1 Tax=Pseudomonas sp. NPDC089534 TaxID=3364468 RepID=UPI00382A1066
MPLRIMMWNAQHFDNQGDNPSVAYREKLAFLRHCLTQREVDILALFETGKTGDLNERLVIELSNSFSLVAGSLQEDGKKKSTTLGTLVFARNELAGDFEKVTEYVLSGTEQRSAILIRHIRTGFGFAFYHANSSYLAPGNILDTVGFIVRNLETLKLSALKFFGGDLNYDARESYKEIKTTLFGSSEPDNPYSKRYAVGSHVLTKLVPEGPGYTHASIRSAHRIVPPTEEQRAFERSELSQGRRPRLIIRLRRVWIATVRTLDYAYVEDIAQWTAECNAAVDRRAEDIERNSGPVRMAFGARMRSDHFPVFYTHNA